MSEVHQAARAVLLLRDALDVDTGQRASFLDRECAGDAELRAELDALLSRATAHSSAFDEPVLALAGRLMEGEAQAREGDMIGAFRIVALLGEGGMGTVYRAERIGADFTQTVALKIIRSSAPNALLRDRFRRERAILASLDHPGIASFIDGGVTEQGELWFAMTLIDGESITHYAEQKQLDVPQRLQLLALVCDAVAAAHRKLVVHRDIKPSNIIVDASGNPHLLDFGIAKLLDETGGDATLTDARAMTPHYAAPEQIRGETVTTATDVYALGVVLFELMTGRRPFGAGTVTPFHVQRAVLEESRPSLVEAAKTIVPSDNHLAVAHSEAWSKHLRGDLEHIVERAMAREPGRRYGSATALAEDIRRHLGGHPIRARPDTLGYRAQKFIQRNRVGVVLATAAVSALLAITAVSITQARRAERESQRANVAAASARSESTRANEAAEIARLERDAARDESQRQDALREHFVAVLSRASELGESITPAQLTALVTDPHLLGAYKDPDLQRALDLAVIDFFLVRGDFPRVLTLLDALEPRLRNAPRRYRAMAAADRAFAAVRVGNLELADASINSAETDMSAEQRNGGGLGARLEMLRGQLQRARGELPAAAVTARRSAALATAATDISEFERGAILGSAAVALLQLGDLDAAAQFAGQADQVWSDAGVTANASMRNVATVRTNALFLRGELLAAVAGMASINADTSTTESLPSRAARDITQAKALALLDRRAEAITLVDSAVAHMCDAVGSESLDCLRVRLSSIDTLYIAGQSARARSELAAIQPAIAAHQPLLAAGNSFAALLDFLLTPDDATLKRVITVATDTAKAGALPRRNAVRTLLVLAETVDARGKPVYAETLARTAIDIAGDEITGDGMDPSLLALWSARLTQPASPAPAPGACTSDCRTG
ncbi:MAG: serine/threonine protein kinase [Rhodanobacteraceae bacterium]|nr:serine/threonine protein kinase [Rhodanobacteraceae bacterium]